MFNNGMDGQVFAAGPSSDNKESVVQKSANNYNINAFICAPRVFARNACTRRGKFRFILCQK